MKINVAILAEELERRFNKGTKVSPTPPTPSEETPPPLDLTGIRLFSSAPMINDYENDVLYVAPASAEGLRPLPRKIAFACVSELESKSTLKRLMNLDSEQNREVLIANLGKNGTPELLANLLLQVKEWFDAWDEELLCAIVQHESDKNVLDIASRALVNPIALFDSSSALVTYAGSLDDDHKGTIWDVVIGKGYTPMSYYTKEERESFNRQFVNAERLASIRPARNPTNENITATVTVEGTAYAYLSQVDIVMPFSRAQRSLLLHIRDRFQEMAVAGMGTKQHKKPLEHCVRLILEGDKLAPSMIGFHLGQRGWKLNDSYRVVVCPCPDASNIKYYLMRFATLLPSILMVDFEGSIVCMLNSRERNEDALAKSRAQLDPIDGIDLYGESSEFDDFMALRSHYRQAVDAIEEGRRDSAKGLVCFDDCFMAHLHHLIDGPDVLEEYGSPHLLTYLRHADESADEAVRSLYVYLLCGCNFTKAAKQLFMHRNTLEYRIDKLGSELDMDFAKLDADESFRAIFTCAFFLGGAD